MPPSGPNGTMPLTITDQIIMVPVLDELFQIRVYKEGFANLIKIVSSPRSFSFLIPILTLTSSVRRGVPVRAHPQIFFGAY